MSIYATSDDFVRQFEYLDKQVSLNEPSRAILRTCFTTLKGAVEVWQGKAIEIGPTDGISCGVIGNTRFNAAAKLGADGEYLAVYSGAAIKLYDCFQALLSTPSLFPMADGACSESNSLSDVGEYILSIFQQNDDTLEWGHMPPKTQARRKVVHDYVLPATLALVYHEIGHIVKGHLAFLSAEHDVATLDELYETSGLPTSTQCMHALELDADMTAARRSLQHVAVMGVGHYPDTSLAERLVVWAAGSYLMFLILDIAQTARDPRGTITHPSPLTRMSNFFAAAKDEYRKCYHFSTAVNKAREYYSLPLKDYDQIVQSTIEHVKAVWDTTGIPAHSFAHPNVAIEKGIHTFDYLRMLIDFGLRDYMRDRGDRLSAAQKV